MSTYNISGLMDSYKDNEFLIEGQPSADTDSVVKGVMEKITPKRRLHFGARIFAAAAIAVTALIITAASWPQIVYNLENGHTLTVLPGETVYRDVGERAAEIYEVRDGRVYFIFDGQNIEITDQIDFDNAYYYRSDITDNQGNTHERWIAVGGTPEHIAYAETIVNFDGLGNNTMSLNGDFSVFQYYVDGEVISFFDWQEEYADKYPGRDVYFNWTKKFERDMVMKGEIDEEYFESRINAWSYPLGYEGERVEDNIPFPDNLYELEK